MRTDDPSLINFRRGLRDAAFTGGAHGAPEFVEPPPPSQLGTLSEEHVAADAALLEAGAHCGATHEELVRFTQAALHAGQPPEVSVSDGTKAVLLGLAAHRSIDTGRPVLWSARCCGSRASPHQLEEGHTVEEGLNYVEELNEAAGGRY